MSAFRGVAALGARSCCETHMHVGRYARNAIWMHAHAYTEARALRYTAGCVVLEQDWGTEDANGRRVRVTYSADFSSSVDCRLGSGCCPSSCRSRSTSCFAAAYSPSVMVWIFDCSSLTLRYARARAAREPRASQLR